VHDPSLPAYLPLRFLHILGAMLFLGGLVAALYWKLTADRSGDAAHAAKVHARLRRADRHLVGTGALLTFAAGYSMVRFLGGRISEHAFVLWGLIVMFAALALWYFPMRRLGDALTKEAEVCALKGEPLTQAYAAKSVAWLALGIMATTLVVVVAVMMVFRLPGG
jgi:uncharacterized membrane protein